VRRDERGQDAGDDENVNDVKTPDEDSARILAAKKKIRYIGACDRDGQQDAGGDPHSRPGQVIVGQRIAEESLRAGERKEYHADHPVNLPRPAESAGEEYPDHMHADSGDKYQRGVMMDLPDQQAAADIKLMYSADSYASLIVTPSSLV